MLFLTACLRLGSPGGHDEWWAFNTSVDVLDPADGLGRRVLHLWNGVVGPCLGLKVHAELVPVWGNVQALCLGGGDGLVDGKQDCREGPDAVGLELSTRGNARTSGWDLEADSVLVDAFGRESRDEPLTVLHDRVLVVRQARGDLGMYSSSNVWEHNFGQADSLLLSRQSTGDRPR